MGGYESFEEMCCLENLSNIHGIIYCHIKDGLNLTEGVRFKIRIQSTFQAGYAVM
jgi:hypothetical protein